MDRTPRMGEYIKENRDLLGLSLTEMAAKACVGVQTIHRIEKQAAMPTFKTWEKICKVFGTSAERMREIYIEETKHRLG